MSDFEEWFAQHKNRVMGKAMAKAAWDHQAKRIAELEQQRDAWEHEAGYQQELRENLEAQEQT